MSGSGASRTLVLSDGVPLNDPFGSWVYWNRIPQAAVDRVEVVRGATGDLYGADALGGVIQVLTFSPDRTRARAAIEGGSYDTFRGSLFGGVEKNGWGRVGGLRRHHAPMAPTPWRPKLRGPIDTRADSDYQTGFVNAGKQAGTWHAWLKGAALRRGTRQRHAAAGQHHRLAADLGHQRRQLSRAASGRRKPPAAARTTTRRSRPSAPTVRPSA